MRFSSFCAVCALFVLSDVACASDASAETKGSETIVVDVGPGVKDILPIRDWNRCMGDTAMNVTQWQRWWKYVRCSPEVVMNWVDGLKIKIYPANEVYRSLYVNGMYDPNMVAILKDLLNNGDVFIDVGANCGYISLPVLKSIGEHGKIIAIEPSSRDYKRLVENVDLNKLNSQIKTIQMAVGDRLGSKTMLIASEERSNCNTLGDKFAFSGIEKAKTEEVNVTTIDNIVDTENLTKVDVIKLDVEGSEVRCLEGAVETVKKFRPAIVIRVNSDALQYNQRSVESLQKFLSESDYRIYDLEITDSSCSLVQTEKIDVNGSNIKVALHRDVQAPTLTQPKKMTTMEKVESFFK